MVAQRLEMTTLPCACKVSYQQGKVTKKKFLLFGDVGYTYDIKIIVNSLVYFWEDVMVNHICHLLIDY